MTSAQISATPGASTALRRAVAEHGALMFHTSGGRVGGRQYPICLPADALRIGARDHLLGEVEGVPVYAMEDREGSIGCRAEAYVLDVAPGPAIGFSIAAAHSMRFTLTPVSEGVCCSDFGES
ncbi:DUF779 domain-containing protein [Hyphomicrobium sp.]|jgi:uncharacterized protein (DUF779 family)|uniref:DUF779 domain-containing protein n=1 Tax=Hyphomicrobium sp. TaxID=82 RepID=UPI002BAA0CB3|nr:DUF779 domain-containing protein [Hyphomicrobium sp.]HVZ05735.1 DUF779 domain-containing protein [Hyphomicrobium sp.]